jgi:hypothetical protein
MNYVQYSTKRNLLRVRTHNKSAAWTLALGPWTLDLESLNAVGCNSTVEAVRRLNRTWESIVHHWVKRKVATTSTRSI